MVYSIALFSCILLVTAAISFSAYYTDKREASNLIYFMYGISNGYCMDWEDVKKRLSELPSNPYPNIDREWYENERKQHIF